MSEIYVLQLKSGLDYRKTVGWKDTRKLLVYTSEKKAWAAVKARGLNPDYFEVIAYTPKEETENDEN